MESKMTRNVRTKIGNSNKQIYQFTIHANTILPKVNSRAIYIKHRIYSNLPNF